MDNNLLDKNNNIKNSKSKESVEVFNMKINLDSSYRYHSFWKPVLYILITFCSIFFIWGLICTLSTYKIIKISESTVYGINIACGFCYLFLFAILWYLINYVNTKVYLNSNNFIKINNASNQRAFALLKKSNIYSAITRVDLCLCTVICGLCYVSAGYAYKDHIQTSQIISTIAIAFMFILEIIGCIMYYLFIRYKTKGLNLLVINE